MRPPAPIISNDELKFVTEVKMSIPPWLALIFFTGSLSAIALLIIVLYILVKGLSA